MKHIKSEFDKLTFKEMLIYVLAILAMICGLVLLFMGMFIAPQGEIHSSVLTAFGSICIFVPPLLGISIHYSNELLKFKTQAISMVEDIAITSKTKNENETD